jgi:hypothetical protein
LKTATDCEECEVTITQMMMRLVVSLCLALLAASVPSVRAAVLNHIGAPEFLPRDASAGGLDKAARAFD